MEPQNLTSLIIPVNEATFVQPFRRKHLHRPGVTMPPHITLQSPFKPAGTINAHVLSTLEAICQSYQQFNFTLATTNRFATPGVLYLQPNPVEPFIALHHIIQTHFPTDSKGAPVMHLTLAGWYPTELDDIAEDFHAEYGDRLPIIARATNVCLFEQRKKEWIKLATFALAESGP